MIARVQCLPLFIWIKLCIPTPNSRLSLGQGSIDVAVSHSRGWSHIMVHKAAPFLGLEEGRFPKERVCGGKGWLASLPQRHSFFMVPHAPVFVLGQVPAHHSRRQRSAQGWIHRGNNQLWDCLGSVSNKTPPSYGCVLISMCVRSQKALFWTLGSAIKFLCHVPCNYHNGDQISHIHKSGLLKAHKKK